MASIQPNDITNLLGIVNSNSLRVKQLSTILGNYGLSKTGVKSDQQKRLAELIQDSVRKNNVAVFYQILNDVYVATNHQIPAHAMMTPAGTLSQNAPTTYGCAYPTLPTPVSTGSSLPGWTIDSVQPSHSPRPQDHLEFKESPFYEVRSQVNIVKQCPQAATHYRGYGTIHIKIANHPELLDVVQDRKLRIYVMCANEIGKNLNITFPYQSQLRINNQEKKANLRGLKKKPGSTQPVDITDDLELKVPNYENAVELIYENTDRPFYFGVYICRINPVDELIESVISKSRITKETVIKERARVLGGGGDDESDIEATSERLTLKCPLSFGRLSVPCRGIKCAHQQCFDAQSYLLLQQQGPTWSCPICNKHTPYDQLAVDEYMQDILRRTHSDTEYVIIEPNGDWEEPNISKPQPSKTEPTDHTYAQDLDSYNLSEYAATPPPLQQQVLTEYADPAVVLSGGAASTIGPTNGNTGGAGTKRKVVIDLTLSDDEEYDRPTKRPAISLPQIPPTEPILNYSSIAARRPPPADNVTQWLSNHPDNYEDVEAYDIPPDRWNAQYTPHVGE